MPDKDNTTDGAGNRRSSSITPSGANLIIAPNVKTTAAIEKTIALLDPYFEGLTSVITSGLRTREDQLNIIIEKVERHHIDKLFDEFPVNKSKPIDFKVDGRYWWQRAWSKLLAINEIVNPPLPAEALFDYFRPGSDVNRKGRIIDISNHMKGLSFDIGGAADLDARAEAVKKAAQDGLVKNYLVEKTNNAVHVDCIAT